MTTREQGVERDHAQAAGVGLEWRSLRDPPDATCAALLYTPAHAAEGASFGEDYRIEIARFVRDPKRGDMWLEQGTNHEIGERAEWDGYGHLPTLWATITPPPPPSSAVGSEAKPKHRDEPDPQPPSLDREKLAEAIYQGAFANVWCRLPWSTIQNEAAKAPVYAATDLVIALLRPTQEESR